MSTADLAVLGLTAESITATVGWLRLASRVSPRLQIGRGAAQQQEPETATPDSSSGISALPAARASREAEFARHRAENKSVAEAGAAVGIAERTARTYEARRLAARNGAGHEA